jgi:OPA family glycerol-3-phosphate transporter-like MFS transporter 1/2
MFSKMCAYSVLYWGPYYLTSLGFAPSHAGYLCSFFDLGGIVGGITAGWLSDRLGSSGVVAFAFQLAGVPLMQVYFSGTQAAGASVTANALLMMLVGLFVNAPYALITTAVSADLGQKVEGDAKLLALVTGIIDGTGSFGAMVQGIVVGHMSADSWGNVWHFLMLAQAASALMLVRLVERDVRVMRGLARRDEQR